MKRKKQKRIKSWTVNVFDEELESGLLKKLLERNPVVEPINPIQLLRDKYLRDIEQCSPPKHSLDRPGFVSGLQEVTNSVPKPDAATNHPIDKFLASIDSEKYTNEHGGSQTKLNSACHLLPPKACLEIGKILCRGAANYGIDNWKKIPSQDHINHALVHLMKFQAVHSATPQDRIVKLTELAQASCRVLFALEMLIEGFET